MLTLLETLRSFAADSTLRPTTVPPAGTRVSGPEETLSEDHARMVEEVKLRYAWYELVDRHDIFTLRREDIKPLTEAVYAACNAGLMMEVISQLGLGKLVHHRLWMKFYGLASEHRTKAVLDRLGQSVDYIELVWKEDTPEGREWAEDDDSYEGGDGHRVRYKDELARAVFEAIECGWLDTRDETDPELSNEWLAANYLLGKSLWKAELHEGPIAHGSFGQPDREYNLCGTQEDGFYFKWTDWDAIRNKDHANMRSHDDDGNRISEVS